MTHARLVGHLIRSTLLFLRSAYRFFAHRPSMSELRKRKGGAAAAEPTAKPTSDLKRATIDTSAGHLGVTLANASAIDGVQIQALCDLDLVYKAGLREGDVIKAIDTRLVRTHEEAMKIFDEANGATVTVEYATKAQAEVEATEQKAASRARLLATGKAAIKTLVAVVALLAVALAVGYKYAPQEYVQDPIDIYVKPVLGLRGPELGYDGAPKRRPLVPKDPKKPWTVDGWDRNKEDDAWARLKKTSMWELRGPFEAKKVKVDDPADTEWAHDIMAQNRATGGKIIEHLELLTAEIKEQQAEMQKFAKMRDDPNAFREVFGDPDDPATAAKMERLMMGPGMSRHMPQF